MSSMSALTQTLEIDLLGIPEWNAGKRSPLVVEATALLSYSKSWRDARAFLGAIWGTYLVIPFDYN